MITVEKAIELIAQNIPELKTITLEIEKCHGKSLAQNIYSERDQPPFNRVAMDGVAIDFNEFQRGRREFKIQAIQQAGAAPLKLESIDSCIEVMTGGVLPINSNVVVRYEDTSIENDKCIISEELTFNMMNNVHQKGSDHKQGDLLLSRGQVINGPQMGIITSNGYKELSVIAHPKIAVISTGDELVELDQIPKDYQIRRSNSYAIETELRVQGFFEINSFHLPDVAEVLYHKLSEILNAHDILILSGGVSMGKFDFLPQVFNDLKIKKVFHNVSQRPGKPFWFGATEHKAVFALPGNPVSAITCLRRFVIPALLKEIDKNCNEEYAFIDCDFNFDKDLTYFLPVKLYFSEGKCMAKPIKTNGSGDYGSLGESDGFIELPKEQKVFKKNEAFKVFRWGK